MDYTKEEKHGLLLYDLALAWAKNPNKENLIAYTQTAKELDNRIREINRQNSFSLFKPKDELAETLIKFYCEKIPGNKEDMEKTIERSLKGKKILEIGASDNFSKVFSKYADYYVAETELTNKINPHSGEKRKVNLANLYKENNVKALFVKENEMVPKELEKTGPFDIICSRHVWTDGTSESYNPGDFSSIAPFKEYHKALKPFGLIYHTTFPMQGTTGKRDFFKEMKEEFGIVMLPGDVFMDYISSYNGLGIKIK